MITLDKTLVARTEHSTPAEIALFASDTYGAGAVVRAVRDLRAGKTVSFAMCGIDNKGLAWNEIELKRIIRFSCPEDSACLRAGVKAGDPVCIGSETILGSLDTPGTSADLDPVAMAAYLMQYLSHESHLFFLLQEGI